MRWWIGIEGVEGVMEYFQECFWVGVVFFNLGGDSDWAGVRGWCVSEVHLGFLIFLVGDNFGG